MAPSLWKLKGPDQSFPDWVCGDCEAREHVISSSLFVCHLHQSNPCFVLSDLKLKSVFCYVCALCVVTLLFSSCRTDCGFHALEYLAKWEGRIVPAITAATVVELRKIHTWNWLTNEDFNKRSGAREFVQEAVKKVTKKYKWSRGVTDRTHTLHSVAEECKVLSHCLLLKTMIVCYVVATTPRRLLCSGGVRVTFE